MVAVVEGGDDEEGPGLDPARRDQELGLDAGILGNLQFIVLGSQWYWQVIWPKWVRASLSVQKQKEK